MNRWLRQLFSKRVADRRRPICHLRENGPIAYEGDFFHSAPRDTLDTMIDCPLSWSWRAGPRGWTALTRWSASAFLDDLGSSPVLIAGLSEEPPVDVSDAMARGWIERFCVAEASPLEVAISAGERQFLFVQQRTADPVQALLDALRLDPSAAEIRPYARLGPTSLEALARHL